MAGAVRTYEIASGQARLSSAHESMRAASTALPQGAYTTFRTYGGNRVLRLDQHLRRLEESVALQGQPVARLDALEVRTALREALAAEGRGVAESRVRLTFASPSLFASIEPFEPLPPELHREGAWCVTVPLRRENPHAKDTRFLEAASGAYESLPPGVQEGLMLAEDGAILEGLSSNFFAVRKGVLRTEEECALLGVTRSLVLEVAAGLVPVEASAVRRAELGEVSECFITSVSREILPVVRIDERTIGDGRPGPITRGIMASFADLVAREAEPLTSPPISPPLRRPGS
jgi:branched-chain amino acid aminotransferase